MNQSILMRQLICVRDNLKCLPDSLGFANGSINIKVNIERLENAIKRVKEIEDALEVI